jgi:AhpD family alkylhydroperoxidase
LSHAVAGGTLPPAVRERLAIATAQLNGCEYCLSAHTFIGAKIAKVDADELDRARWGESDDPHVAALLNLSNDIAENAVDVDEIDVKAALEAGVTEEEIGELVANLALNVMTNYFNVLAKVETTGLSSHWQAHSDIAGPNGSRGSAARRISDTT